MAAVILVLPVSAQFSSMSSDHSGSRLFFSTELAQTGAGQPAWGKAFVATASGVQPFLVLNREVTAWEEAGRRVQITNFYNIDGIHLASGGSALSVQALRECAISSASCGYADQTTVYNDRGETILTASGRLLLSPNGKWALRVAGPLTSHLTLVSIFDLVNKAVYPILPGVSFGNREWWLHDIADDGTAVIAGSELGSGDQILILRPPNSVRVAWRPANPLGSATIDAVGRLVAWSERDRVSGRGSVHLLRLRPLPPRARMVDNSEAVDVTPESWDESKPQLSDDGTQLLLISIQLPDGPPQLQLLDTTSLTRRQITSELEGIATGVLSGDGRVAWALTRRGRLVRIDTDSSAVKQITPPLAAFLRPAYYPNTQVPPGVSGTPGEAIALPASVMPGESVEITVDGQLMPILAVNVQSVLFQLPWTLNVGIVGRSITIRKPATQEWSGNTYNLNVYDYWGTFTMLAHQDFSGPVTTASPARPGEIVHLFGTGFGPVSPAVGDGPTPLTPLSRLVLPHECEIRKLYSSVSMPAAVLFAGLAPLLTGVYQFDVRLPDPLPISAPGEVELACKGAGQTGAAFATLAAAP